MHWTEKLELQKRGGYRPPAMEPRDFGDNDPSDPEQNWDKDWNL